MIIDKSLMLSAAQAVTATAASTNYIDLGAARDIGNGQGLELIVNCDTAALSTGSSTVTFALQSDDNTSFSSPTTVATSAAIAKASLTAATVVWRAPIPKFTAERYLRLYYTVAVADLTAGAFTAFIVLNGDGWKNYDDSLAHI